ncbi:Secernin-2 [Dermatophagoides farinae]|uniref:Secernin-2 n=1 Tax=Dermatophagoides farinae TaxID=6954 RepID=A0A922HQ27_DERFA|nr:Secernin-2 [Dermatophagoides farinae]
MKPINSCDTFVVLPTATANGQMIFGKNSDRPAGEVQEIVFNPRQRFENDCKQKCTYIEIDSIPETYSVILSKPVWMWGAEMGSNEHGVCIGNEAIWNRLINDEKDLNKKLLGMDLVRLGLERSRTALEAMDVITKLLKDHGQGGPCSNTQMDFFYHNGFLIADPNEAWIIETVDSEYVAEKVSGKYRNISNCLSIGTKIDRISDGMKQLAIDSGLWNGNDEFDFAKIFTDNNHNDRTRYDAGKKFLDDYTKDNNFDIKKMMQILRDKTSGICRPCDDGMKNPTASSQVSVLSSDLKQRPSVHWFTGTPDSEYSYYKPFIFHPKVRIASEKTRSMNCFPNVSIDDTQVDRRHYLYRKHEEFYSRLRNVDDDNLHQTLRQIENLCIDELEQMLKSGGYNNSENDESNEIDNLFSDSVESELRFYR